MSTSTTHRLAQPARARLSPTAAFYLQVSLVVSFLAGSIAPTPLYRVYQAQWGFSAITITVVFAIYALAVLSALLTVGSLSDHVGRRPVLLVTTALQAVTMLVFATAHGVPALIIARVVQGLATGAAIGAIGAGMLDVDRAKGTIANAIGPMVGTATGGLLSGLFVAFLPAPTQLIYLVLLAIFVAQGVGVLAMAETATPAPGALASLRPHLGVPRAMRRPLLLATPALIAAWAIAGFYGALGPTIVRQLAGSPSLALGGIAVFVLASSGIAAVLTFRQHSPRVVMIVGTTGMIAGTALSLIAIDTGSLAAFFVGTMLAGAGFGGGFHGAIRAVVPLAAAHERAGVLSVLYVISYTAMGLPTVLAGLGCVYGGGVVATAHAFGAFVITLAAIALVGAVVRRRAIAPSSLRPCASVSQR